MRCFPKQNNIVIEDTFDELKYIGIQELLHLLSYLAHEENQRYFTLYA